MATFTKHALIRCKEYGFDPKRVKFNLGRSREVKAPNSVHLVNKLFHSKSAARTRYRWYSGVLYTIIGKTVITVTPKIKEEVILQ